MYFFELVGIIFSIYLVIKFVNKLKSEIPLLELFILLIAINYIISPFFLYNSFFDDTYLTSNTFFLKKSDYFNLIVPCVLSFYFGIFLFNKTKIELVDLNYCVNYFRTNTFFLNYFIVIGLSSWVANFFYPNFFVYILASLLYISLYIVQLINYKYKNIYTLIILSLFLLDAFRLTVFHVIFFKLIIYSLFYFKVNNIKLRVILSYFFIFLFTVIFFGAIKQAYRQGKDVLDLSFKEQVIYFKDLMVNSLPIIYENQNAVIFGFINRINLGGNVNIALENVPKRINYFYGSTYLDNIINICYLNSIITVNKSLKPIKKMSITDIDKFYFEYVSNISLGDNTTINFSYIETAYINFGKVGAFIICFLYGLFLKLFFNYYLVLSKKYYYVQFFLFYYFAHLSVVETGLQQVFNFLFKSILVFYIFILITNRIFFKRKYIKIEK